MSIANLDDVYELFRRDLVSYSIIRPSSGVSGREKGCSVARLSALTIEP